MPFIVITPPSVGETTKLDTFAQPVIDNLNFLNGEVAALGGAAGLANGSFETGTGVDTAPPGWELVITAGNSTNFETSAANTRHGRQAFSMTTPGSIAGGVTLQSEDFFDVAEGRVQVIKWLMKCSVADTRVTLNLRFYDEGENFISLVQLYDEQVSNPTAWTDFVRSAVPPAGAKLGKLEVVGVNNANAGTVYFDGFVLEKPVRMRIKQALFTANGSLVLPNDVDTVVAEIIAGGGKGGDDGIANYGGHGGFAGQYRREILPATPGGTINVVVGGGGVFGHVNGFDSQVSGAVPTTTSTGGGGGADFSTNETQGEASYWGNNPPYGRGGDGSSLGLNGFAGAVIITYFTRKEN